MTIAFPPPAYLDRLNPEQRAAVLHGDGAPGGPLLVIAGAGSGKTSTLAHRVAHLLVSGADPRRILLMTFSRRAAAEMTTRVGHIAAEVMGDKARAMTSALTWAGTFHAIGARLLREHAAEIGLDPAFTIHDREDSADLMAFVRHRLDLAGTERRFPAKATCLAIYSRAVNARASVEEALRSFPWCADWAAELKRLFGAYVAAKQAGNVLDYDDLLLYWAEMAADPVLAAGLAARFDHVLIDEYQDTNRLQAEVLAALRPDGTGITVVGDDAQAIYSFRAAEVRNILDFPDRFTPRARVVTLERNYRSSAPILAAANAVIAEAAERFTKDLRTDRMGGEPPVLAHVLDEATQANYICADVLEAREAGATLREQAVLFRTAHHSGPLEVELTRRKIPFVKYGGLKFLDTAHVRDLLALLRLAENPRDQVAGLRVLRLLPGIGATSAEAILAGLASAADAAAALAAARVPTRAAADWPAFVETFAALTRGAGWPAEIGLARAWYAPHLDRLREDAGTRQADLAQLEAIAAGYPSRERFLTEITLDPPGATSAEAGPAPGDDDYLIMSTIHSAKGREWRRVYVLNCVDGCLPSDLGVGTSAEIEEERRLLYVAMTRARDSLRLVIPQRFHIHGQPRRGDRHVYAARSRFLTDGTLPHFAQVSWPPPRPDADSPPPMGPRRDLTARVREMWG